MTGSEGAASDGAGEALYGHPTATELLQAAREFLETEVMGQTEGQLQFHTRVTVRVLDTVIRELEMAELHRAQRAALLRDLGYASPWELVDAIREGCYDERIAELTTKLQPWVRSKLEVVNPRYID